MMKYLLVLPILFFTTQTFAQFSCPFCTVISCYEYTTQEYGNPAGKSFLEAPVETKEGTITLFIRGYVEESGLQEYEECDCEEGCTQVTEGRFIPDGKSKIEFLRALIVTFPNGYQFEVSKKELRDKGYRLYKDGVEEHSPFGKKLTVKEVILLGGKLKLEDKDYQKLKELLK